MEIGFEKKKLRMFLKSLKHFFYQIITTLFFYVLRETITLLAKRFSKKHSMFFPFQNRLTFEKILPHTTCNEFF